MTVNRSSLERWSVGPPAPADGFSHAWRVGRRRRRRNALLSTAPVVVAAIVAAALVSPHASSRRGLDTVNGGLSKDKGNSHSSTANHVRPGSATATADAGPGTPGNGPAVNGIVSPGVANGHVVGAPSPTPTSPTAPPQNGTFVVTGRAATYGTFTLRRPALLRFDEMSAQGGQTYVGVYLRRIDGPGDAGFVLFPQLDRPGTKFEMQWGSLRQSVPAGRYTAYVVSDTTATLSIPIHTDGAGDAPHLTVRATKTASLAVHVRQTALALGQSTAALRTASAFDASTTGAVGAYFGSQSSLSGVDVSACLARQGAACASSDPQAHGTTAIAVGGYVGATVDVALGRIKDDRDQLGTVSAPATTSGTLYVITLAVHVR